MESSSSIFMLAHQCRICHIPAKRACAYCHTSFYCNRSCQQLDWKTHQVFCSKDDEKMQACARREACLQKISENGLFTFLIYQKFFRGTGVPNEGFFLLQHQKESFLVLSSYQVLDSMEIQMNEKIYQELKAEVLRCDDSSKDCKLDPISKKNLVVYDISGNKPSVYVLGSSSLDEAAETIHKMPLDLVRIIFHQYVKNVIQTLK